MGLSDLISLLGTGVLSLLGYLVRRDPKGWVGRSLFAEVGPSLDATSMSRGDCIRSAFRFVAIAAGAFWLCALLASIDNRTGADLIGTVPAQVLLFALVLFGMMGLGGALYLLVRAPFRPGKLNPNGDRGIRRG